MTESTSISLLRGSSSQFDQNNAKNGRGHAQKNKVSFQTLFRYSECKDKVLILFGALGCIVCGGCKPLYIVVLAKMMRLLVNYIIFENKVEYISNFITSQNMTVPDLMTNPNLLFNKCYALQLSYNTSVSCDYDYYSNDQLTQKMTDFCLILICLTGGSVLMTIIQRSSFKATSYRQARKIHHDFVNCVLRKSTAWFDIQNSRNITRQYKNIQIVQYALSEDIGQIIQDLSSFLSCLAIGFFVMWKLALATFGLCCFKFFTSIILMMIVDKTHKKEQASLSKAIAVAEKALSSIRTIASLGREDKESQKFSSKLQETEGLTLRKSLALWFTNGISLFMSYTVFSVSIWYGANLNHHQDVDVDDLLSTVFLILCGCKCLVSVLQVMEHFTTVRCKAKPIFELIDKMPEANDIDSHSSKGLKPKFVEGILTFEDVHFSYPSNPDKKVLNGVSFEIKPGQVVACVGARGCGKSTLLQLALRFYDPKYGQVFYDGKPYEELNVQWLRQQFGFVSKESVVNETSARYNHFFEKRTADVMTMDNKTIKNDEGVQLPMKNKQELSINHVLHKEPKVLLLDGVTSFSLFPPKDELAVLVVTNDLRILQKVDNIIVLDRGHVAERGTHKQLIKECGKYCQLIQQQIINEEEQEIKTDTSDKSSHSSVVGSTSFTDLSNNKTKKIEANNSIIIKNLAQRKKWLWIILGYMASVMMGVFPTATAILCAHYVAALPKDGMVTSKNDIDETCLAIIVTGLALFIINFLKDTFFSLANLSTITKSKVRIFKSMLGQPMKWYDQMEDKTQDLVQVLQFDPKDIRLLLISSMEVAIKGIAALSFGITVSSLIEWKVTRLVLVLCLIVVVSHIIETKAMLHLLSEFKQMHDTTSKALENIISNIRTIAYLQKENEISEKIGTLFSSTKKIFFIGLITGLSQTSLIISIVVCFYFGTSGIEDKSYAVHDMIKIIGILLFSLLEFSSTMKQLTDQTDTKEFVKKIYHIFQGTTDLQCLKGKILSQEAFIPSIKFRKAVYFHPLQPHVNILQNLNITVEPGQAVALLGTDDLGKKAIFSILERFYDLHSGSVYIGDQDIKEFNISWLRSQIGWLPQHPVLFDQSIFENISCSYNQRECNAEDIIKAAKKALIHNFISALPAGYHTILGQGNLQLTASQIRRIAIARILLRNPKILLIEEQIKELDSDKTANLALKNVKSGRTCIAIAERPQNTLDADRIFILKDGRIIEDGTYDELMSVRGSFHEFIKAENIGRI